LRVNSFLASACSGGPFRPSRFVASRGPVPPALRCLL